MTILIIGLFNDLKLQQLWNQANCDLQRGVSGGQPRYKQFEKLDSVMICQIQLCFCFGHYGEKSTDIDNHV